MQFLCLFEYIGKFYIFRGNLPQHNTLIVFLYMAIREVFKRLYIGQDFIALFVYKDRAQNVVLFIACISKGKHLFESCMFYDMLCIEQRAIDSIIPCCRYGL